MKVLLSVDIEGISGVVSVKHGDMDSKEYEDARKRMTGEANAAAVGAYDAGAEQVFVTDGHGKMRNIRIEDMDERVELFYGRPKILSQMEGLDQGVDRVGYVGYHSSAHSFGTLAHTYSGMVVDKLIIGGHMAGEFAMNSFLAGEYDVPVFFISGDAEAVKEAKELYPDIPHVVTKIPTGRYSARCRHPEVVKREIRETVANSLNSHGKVIKTQDTSFRMFFKDAGKLDNLELLPEVERVGPKEFVIDTGDYEDNYKLFRACTMLATVVSQD